MRALISVSDKRGIVEFSQELEKLQVEIFSTGGTYDILKENGIRVEKVSDLTGFEEIMEGRVKTLHPKIHGGILADRDIESHLHDMEMNDIRAIDLVVVNLYPFKEIIKKDILLDEAIENIDIGGPTMLRAAAKNYKHVNVVVEPEDYNKIIAEIRKNGNTSLDFRRKLSIKAFEHTANYDSVISNYLRKQLDEKFEQKYFNFSFENGRELRYGENPHQKGSFFGNSEPLYAKQLWGKELSYNNISDASGAIELLMEFDQPTAVNVKHTNPCGVASSDNIYDAFIKAYEADPQSIFGGIVALNESVDCKLAEKLSEIFLEIIIAPDYSDEAMAILMKKKNIRLMQLDMKNVRNEVHIKSVIGGVLIQDRDDLITEKFEVVTEKKPTVKMIEDLYFAFKVVKHQKSNAICLVRDNQTIGLGTGQVSRVFSVENSIRFSKFDTKGTVLASDAFFPFRDSIDAAAKAGVTAIIQPGGSVKDEEVIKACDEYGIVMIFTGMRHFKH
ncbi:MAG: bifunctional phosphoribosylaminoimidazolecarboxamide formyltransferase/IMP cyclohydrolase [Clostridiales bacterium]|nr:bifunctional phosphoribosylaminoimidazolecarboxamide formyltransferase/IMP cyclohydrolase [Clostridiales bacterium]